MLKLGKRLAIGIPPRTMTASELMDLLKSMRYKPYWNCHLWYTQGDWAFLSINADYQHNSDPANSEFGYRVTLCCNPSIYLKRSPNEIRNDIRYYLGVMEKHEMDEFLRFDGERLHDPHGKDYVNSSVVGMPMS